MQPAPAPPETTTQAATTTSATTTSATTTACTSVTTWYVNSDQECVRGVGITTYPTLSLCCPMKGSSGQCCDSCNPSVPCVNGPLEPTPPPTTVSSCTFTLF